MKKIFIALTVFVFAFSSCKKECEFWEEGKKCDTEVREKYFGTYVGTATIGGNTTNAYSWVETNSDGAKFILIEDQIEAELTSSTSFKIPLQNYYANGNTLQIEGTGSFSGTQMIYNCAITSGGNTNLLNFTGSK